MAKRILIGVHHGFSVRYLLQTDILKGLTDGAEQVVIVAAEEGDYLDEFRKMPRVVAEVVPRETCRRYHDGSVLQRISHQLRFLTLGRRVATRDLLWGFQCKDLRQGAKGSPLRRLAAELQIGALNAASGALRHMRPLRRMLLGLESRLYSPPCYDEVLSRHAPDLVVVSSLGTFDYDQYLMRAARRLGMPVATVVLSWDNTTTRGYPGARPDHVVAWTDIMRRELIELHDVAPESIFVGGIAHFDGYYRDSGGIDRAGFLRSLGADPARKLLFVATRAPNSYPWNPNIAEILAEAIRAGRLPGCQVVVRIHPLHYRLKPGGGYVFQEVLDAYDALAARFPAEIVLNRPKLISDRLDYAMPPEEIGVLTGLLRTSDVIVTIFSTVNIEGSIMDKPLVNVCFENLDLHYQVRAKGRFDIVADSELTHNKRVIDTGGIAVARTPGELVDQVAAYLADPSLHAEGRRRIIDTEAGPHRGAAGRAIADHLLALPAGKRAR